MDKNGASIYGAQKCQVRYSGVADFTRKGDTLFTHIYWPSETVTIGGIKTVPASARLLAGGKDIRFAQKGSQLVFLGLPAKAADDPAIVVAAEFGSEPVQDSLASRVIKRIFEIERQQPKPGA
jgi:hypothetical protein